MNSWSLIDAHSISSDSSLFLSLAINTVRYMNDIVKLQ